MWRIFRGAAAHAASSDANGGKEEELDPSDLPLLDAFQKFDRNGDGYIDKEELSVLLKLYLQMEEVPTDQQLARIMAKVDVDQDGKISFKEFKSMMSGTEDETTKYYATFSTFDRDGDGYITFEDLAEVLQLVHPEMKEEEIKSIMKALDQDNDGKIGYPEFVNYFTVS